MKQINQNLGLLILRITVGGLLSFHGLKKLFHGHDFIRKVLIEANLPEFLWVGVPVAEVLAPICLIIGLFTRTAAFLIAFTMLMTFYLVYDWGGFTINGHGAFITELNLFYLLTVLSLYFTGSGNYALSENILKKKLTFKNL